MKYLLFLPDFNETEYYRLIFKKCSNIKFKTTIQRKLSCSMQTVGRIDRQMMKSAASHNFANAPKKAWISSKCTYLPCVKVKPTKGR